MVKFIKKPSTVIYIDHFAIISISRQISLTTSSTNKLNLRLIRAFQYLSIFDLSIRYKASKANIIPNALLRLQRNSASIVKNGLEVLKVLYNQTIEVISDSRELLKELLKDSSVSYYIILIEMFEDFKLRLILKYVKNSQ